MKDILAEIANILKAIGDQPMLELAKSKWIQFSLGAAVLMLAVLPYLPEIIRALQGR